MDQIAKIAGQNMEGGGRRDSDEVKPEIQNVMSKMGVEEFASKMALGFEDMPSMTGIKLVHSISRRSSMFDRQALPQHGHSSTFSRGSFSQKTTIDPSVGVLNTSREAAENAHKIAHMPDLALFGTPSGNMIKPSESVLSHTSSKDFDEQSGRKKTDMITQYENTYQLEPDRKPTRKELSMMFKSVLRDVPTNKRFLRFSDYTMLAHELSDKVIAECKELDYRGYRILCMATVVSRDCASGQQASRQLWDHNRDTWEEASVKLQGATIYLQVYCVYLD